MAEHRTYRRVPFEWPGDRAVTGDSRSAEVDWAPAADVGGLTDLVADVLAASVDASDNAAVAAVGAHRAAERVLSPPTGYSFSPAWWEVVCVGDEPAGFVLPVTFDGCARDGLDEATIYHMGVAPPHRGQGLARALLRRATTTLTDHGVWRIHCDTAAANSPMIHVFETEGWTRLAEVERPIVVPD